MGASRSRRQSGLSVNSGHGGHSLETSVPEGISPPDPGQDAHPAAFDRGGPSSVAMFAVWLSITGFCLEIPTTETDVGLIAVRVLTCLVSD